MTAQAPGDALAAETLVTEVDSTSVGNPAPVASAEGEREDVGTSIGDIEDNTMNAEEAQLATLEAAL